MLIFSLVENIMITGQEIVLSFEVLFLIIIILLFEE